MSVHKKLMEARLKLQATTLKKSGHNKFANYTYFELGDFLPTIQKIFSEVGLCGVISFDKELATLTITDTEGNGDIKITSPMEGAALKGCHPIQNLGAVETYTRRYLWVTAMEIVEHDILDATTGSSKPETRAAANHPDGKGDVMPPMDAQEVLDKNPYGDLDEESQQFLRSLANDLNSSDTVNDIDNIYKQVSTLLNVEKLFINSLLSSKVRSALKSYSQNLKKAA